MYISEHAGFELLKPGTPFVEFRAHALSVRSRVPLVQGLRRRIDASRFGPKPLNGRRKGRSGSGQSSFFCSVGSHPAYVRDCRCEIKGFQQDECDVKIVGIVLSLCNFILSSDSNESTVKLRWDFVGDCSSGFQPSPTPGLSCQAIQLRQRRLPRWLFSAPPADFSRPVCSRYGSLGETSPVRPRI